jgi:hypothetical protein
MEAIISVSNSARAALVGILDDRAEQYSEGRVVAVVGGSMTLSSAQKVKTLTVR